MTRATTRLSIVLALAALALLAGQSPTRGAFPSDPPNDPLYPAAAFSTGSTGQWDLFGFIPNGNLVSRPSGISADLAWPIVLGGGVTVAVLDSGVDYDHADLRQQIVLRPGECPEPRNGGGAAAPGVFDLNGDGVFNIDDYAADPRVGDLNGDGLLGPGDLRVAFANGIDDDLNGYVDDLTGWDSADDDGDEFDFRYFGHGTGRNGFIGARTNNGIGMAGLCPACRLMNVRVDRTFVVNPEGVAKGAIYAVDNGARVINMALGALGASAMLKDAFVYTTKHDVLALNATANEFSSHPNFMTAFDDVVGVGAVVPDNTSLTTTYLQKAAFSNYGPLTDVVAPSEAVTTSMGRSGSLPDHNRYGSSSGTSSAVPHAAGVAAMIFSRGDQLVNSAALDAPLSALEVKQILCATADDVTLADGGTYPVLPGWDRWTGYGRVNTRAAVDRVAPHTIPPEADINSPDWYDLVDTTATTADDLVPVDFYANARRETSFSWQLEYGVGIEPAVFLPIASNVGAPSNPLLSSADLVNNFSALWNVTGLPNGGYTLRLRVTDDRGNVGEDRMFVFVIRDADYAPGFPIRIASSSEGSMALVDLNGDNTLEMVFADASGFLHALRADGTEAPGFPVHTDFDGFFPAASPAFDGNPANGEVRVSYASVVSAPAVGDIDRDGVQEIVLSALDGKIYAWNADGSVQPGFPVSTDPETTEDPYSHVRVLQTKGSPVGSSPALGDLDRDGKLEIVAGAGNQKLYAWRFDGARFAPFPVALFDPAKTAGPDPVDPAGIISSPALADIDGDGWLDIVVGTNESYGDPRPPEGALIGGGSGRAYAVSRMGQVLPGWPVKPTSLSPCPVPVVACGVGTSPVVADLDSPLPGGDPNPEIALGAFFGDTFVYNHDGSLLRAMNSAVFGAAGAGGNPNETVPEGGLPNATDAPSRYYVASPAFADLNADGLRDLLVGHVGDRLATFSAGSGVRAIFDHLFAAFDPRTGLSLPNFPRVMNDWQFLSSSTTANVSALPGQQHVIAGSGIWYLHAFDALGAEPLGWPKLTGGWIAATAAVGDVDLDGGSDVAVQTRQGYVFRWRTPGNPCSNSQWWRARHDDWNTGSGATDSRRPAAIRDLTATPGPGGAVTLTWTAPGDDARCGTASAYQIRVSSAPITEAGFGSAAVVAAPPAPGAPGALQSKLVTGVSGTRHFAIRALDEQGNAGALGPNASVTIP
jgi:subtilisin family serine protease